MMSSWTNLTLAATILYGMLYGLFGGLLGWGLVYLSYVFARMLKSSYFVVIKPVNKYGLVLIMFIILVGFAGLACMIFIQIIIEYSILATATYLALFLFGFDLIALAKDVQTDESKALMRKNKDEFEMLPKDDEKKYADFVIESSTKAPMLLWHLLVFVLYVGILIALGFAFPESEACFSNWANLGVASVVIGKWVTMGQMRCSCFWKTFAAISWIMMIVICSFSCDCTDGCDDWSVAMTAIASVWSVSVLMFEHLCA